MFGDELAAAYAAADVFVFPSRTDTFGLVMIEALACGMPVAGLSGHRPGRRPDAETGAMEVDLTDAIAEALTKDRAACAGLWPQLHLGSQRPPVPGALRPTGAGGGRLATRADCFRAPGRAVRSWPRRQRASSARLRTLLI